MIERICVKAVYFVYALVAVVLLAAAALAPFALLYGVYVLLGEKIAVGVLVIVSGIIGVYCGRKTG